MSLLLYLHLLQVQNKATIENRKRQRTLASKNHDLFVCDLVGDAHVGGDPLLLVDVGQHLPDVSPHIVALYRIYDLLLVYPSSKGEQILVLEGTEADTGPGDAETGYVLPLVLLRVVLLTVAIDLVIDERSHNVDESFDDTERMICSGVLQASSLHQVPKYIVVFVARIQIFVRSFDKPSNKIDSSSFGGYRPRI
eukprot:CAMPEP_0202960110 /NCGR_PEP_ID=MMETSP1396-20130829/4265_1 /ASSEMBLY_ACC=CAM_ASM_000872 /TAXON_ID= /ORGANISM="Pseudokeronopsis sp., Strain Brazil" /LENGTH=194 /DNA_ID=CAMNT_0049679101 /DNA_START=163 /DNA_END=747 /DNA_ORIENTATION=+